MAGGRKTHAATCSNTRRVCAHPGRFGPPLQSSVLSGVPLRSLIEGGEDDDTTTTTGEGKKGRIRGAVFDAGIRPARD